MKAYFKGKVTDANFHTPIIENRGFLYGDGLFETMISHNGKVKYLSTHIDRLINGLSCLQIDKPDLLNHDSLSHLIKELDHSIGVPEFSKIKLVIWRQSEGTYLPTKNQSEILILIDSYTPRANNEHSKISFSKEIFNHYSKYSRFKSVNALHYVLAGLEMKNRGLDDIIILDHEGHISECLVSNIFWVKGGSIFTPALSTGCIEGVSRKIILEEVTIQIREVSAKKEDLLQAESVFTTNATGICHIKKIEGTAFKPYRQIEEIYRPF